MLANQYYYHALLRKYVVYFGSLFNDIAIERTDENGDLVQTITVPISYGPKQKFIARLEQDPEAAREIAIILPRLSFEIKNIEYDSTRKLNPQQKIVKGNPVNTDEYKYTYTPVPYNITFELSIYSKNVEDGLQVVEQVLPFFAPEWTNQLILVPEMDIRMDVPVVLKGLKMDDRYEGSMEAPRYIITTMSFEMKGYLFGPVRNSGLIKRVTTNIMEDGISLYNYNSLSVTSNSDPAFQKGEYVYQTDGTRTVASGIVEYSNSSYVQVKNYSGIFSTANTLLSTNTNSIATVTDVLIVKHPKIVTATTPGLLANGQPTTNSSLSISIDNIKPTDNYGIAKDVSEFWNGWKQWKAIKSSWTWTFQY